MEPLPTSNLSVDDILINEVKINNVLKKIFSEHLK